MEDAYIPAGSGWSQIEHRIRAYRERAGLSQSQLAAAIQTTKSQVQRWERGATAPSVRALLMLAPVLSCGPWELVRLPAPPTPADRDTLPLPLPPIVCSSCGSSSGSSWCEPCGRHKRVGTE